MAFPTVAATNSSFQANGGTGLPTTIAISLPASISSGDLLIVLLVTQNVGALTTPSGWTQLLSAVNGGRAMVVYYKTASGSEGSTLNVSDGNDEDTAHISYRITGYNGNPEGTTATGSSTTPDPPNLTPSWGADDDLWLALCGNSNATADLAAPTNYSLTAQPRVAGTQAGGATRNLNAASENPGGFANADNTVWVAATVAVRGTGGQPTVKRRGGVPYTSPTPGVW